jgi:uncharacterized protein YyaL (SSP411 family)
MEDEPRLAPLRQKLLAARSRRVRPGLDDKILADWNGLMIAALVNASLVLEEPSWLQNAARAFLFIDGKMGHGDRLGHSWRDSRLLVPGLASDLAAMIRAALALHEATGEGGYLERALAWQAALDRHYANPDTGGYFLTADDAEGLVVRPNSIADEATPNPNAVAAQNLVRLAFYTGQDAWRAQADKLLDGLLPLANENLFMHVGLLNALDLRLRTAEIVVVGSGPQAHDLIAAALATPFLDRIVLRAPTAAALPDRHLAQHKIRAAPAAGAFVCVAETCSLPVANREQLAQTLAAMRPATAAAE